MTLTPNKKETLKERVKLLPLSPGVYRFLNTEGKVIYIGKAKNLKNRVSQYFQSETNLSSKTKVMVSKIADIKYTVVENEEDALLLENNLIKEFQPRYNVMLKDGKTYPWVCVKREPFPRVFVTRKISKDGSTYFGPYTSALHAHNLIDLVNSLYYLRDCKLSLSTEAITAHKYRPCLKYHIGKCKAPCIGLFDETQYMNQIEDVFAILKGDTSALLKEFKYQMQRAADELRFEDAYLFKLRIETLSNHYSKSLVANQSLSDIDVFSMIFESNLAFGNYIRIVKGNIVQSLNLEFKMQIEEEQAKLLSLFITDIHSKFGNTSAEIIVPFLPDAEVLHKKCHIPQRGDKLSLLKLSEKNAAQLRQDKMKQEEALRPEEFHSRTLETLMKDLDMTTPPVHIECFDNSNIQGKYAVSSCVVFKNGIPSKKDYRHFNVKYVVGANDFATMKEVVNRRYSRMLAEQAVLPQLIIIDGGRGQLNYAYETLCELGIEDKIKIIGIAKRLEELIVPGDPHPLFLDKNSPSLRLIMHLRDEAHRFGITHHRNRRSKGQISSELRSMPGVGEKTAQKLLSRFKSLSAIKQASLEDIQAVVGKNLAEKVVSALGKPLSN